METNKIDNLFRENLGNLPSKPSQESWGKLEAMMVRKKRGIIFWYYKVAAVGLLLLCSIYFTIIYSNDPVNEPKVATVKMEPAQKPTTELAEKMIAEAADQPSVAGRDTVKIGTADAVKKASSPVKTGDSEMIAVKSEQTVKQTIEANSIAEVTVEVPTVGEVLNQTAMTGNVERQEIADVAIENPGKEAAPPRRMPIKIIYKRGTPDNTLIAEEKSVQSDSTKNGNNFFKSILNKKRGFANGDLLADIREAKSNFFHHGIDIKNSKIKNSK